MAKNIFILGRQPNLGIAELERLLGAANVELFNEALKNGIGRSKSFGCGMLCVTNKK